MKFTKRNAYSVYVIISGADWFIYSLFSTVAYVYRATKITEDPFQLTLIWTVFTITIILFEIPTGVVADVFSRRLSVIIGYALVAVGALLEGGVQVYEIVLLAQVVWGIGFTFISGARDAWLADELGEQRVGEAYLRGSQIGRIAFMVGIPISTALGTIALQLPIMLAGAIWLLLAGFLIMVMPEEGFQRDSSEGRQSWRDLLQTFSDGVQLVRGRSVLLAILFISTIYGLSSAGFDNLWTVNMLENLSFPAIGEWKPVVWFGIFNAVVSVLGLLGTEIVRRKVDTSQQAAIVRTLMFLTGATATCMVIYGLTTNFWLAAVVYCLSISLRTTSDPLLRTWINQNAESKVRATVLSMDSQLNSLGQTVGGPAIGAIGSALSLPAALVTTGLARVPVTLLFARLVFRGKNGQRFELSKDGTSKRTSK